jgi:hypothetical protein
MRISLAEEPANRILAIPLLEIALLAPELHQFADFLHGQIEAGLAEGTQPLTDFWLGLGGEAERVMNGQTHDWIPVLGERFNALIVSGLMRKVHTGLASGAVSDGGH